MSIDIDRYYSNDWLKPIGDKAERVFEQLPRASAIEAATAVLTQEDTGDVAVPWTTVFPSDELGDVYARLLGVLKTPDGETPFNKAEFRPVINDLKGILFREGALKGQFTACHAAYHLVRVAAGKPEEKFSVYRDHARKWPQYSGEWQRNLVEQFGEGRVSSSVRGCPELFAILDGDLRLSQVDQGRRGSPQKQGESTLNLLQRAFATFDTSTPEGLATAARVMQYRFTDYRRMAYRLRSLEFTS